MKANFLKYSVLVLAAMLSVIIAKAQTVIYHDVVTHDKQGKQVEKIQSSQNNKVYKMVLADDKVTDFYVGGVKIPTADWHKYNDVIAAIRAQVRKNKEQAAQNDDQAAQNAEEAKKNAEEAKLNEAQNKKNDEQARLNDIQNKKNNKAARINDVQAKKNHQENERLVRQITVDLIGDKIIPDAKSLHDLVLNNDEMAVNGIKQAADVFKKYKGKYIKSSKGGFSYHK